MDHMERARVLRASVEVHYNCCQSVLLPFAQELGISEEQAMAIGAHFGSGMRHGGTCGALSGGMMVLGRATEPRTAPHYSRPPTTGGRSERSTATGWSMRWWRCWSRSSPGGTRDKTHAPGQKKPDGAPLRAPRLVFDLE